MKHLTLAAAFAMLALPAHAQDKVTLILDWFVNPDHAPIIVAQEKGFFAEEGWRSRSSPPPIPRTRRSWSPPAGPITRSATSRNCICRCMRACR